MLFAAVGLTTALIYVAWVVWVPLLPSNIFVPLLDLGKITGYTWPAAALYLSIVGSLFALYGLGYELVRRGRARLAPILLFGALFCLVLVGAYPATAADVFGYIAHGRLLASHSANPFLVAPDAFPNDAIVRYLAFPGEPSQYGPLWVALGAGLASVAHGNLAFELILYKIVGALAQLAGASLVFTIARHLGGSECQSRCGAYLFAWNPLLLWEMVGNAHNDGLMMLGALAALWLLLVRPSNVLVLAALATGALVKLPVVVIAPLLFVAQWRRSRVTVVEGFWLALLFAAVVYRPYWHGPETLTALRRSDLFTASLGSVLRLALSPSAGLATASAVARAVSLGAFGLLATLTLVRAARTQSQREIVTLAYVTLLGAALLATTWFQAWYLVWPFALAAALPCTRRHVEVALLSLGGFLQYFVFVYLWVIGVFPPYENLAVQAAALAGIIGPLVLGVAFRYAPRYTHTREIVGAD